MLQDVLEHYMAVEVAALQQVTLLQQMWQAAQVVMGLYG
jgi:hypothetical protein